MPGETLNYSNARTGAGELAQGKLDQKKDGDDKQSQVEREPFEPKAGVPRRYTVAQLLLLREILPYIMCRRDRLNDNAFRYFLVKIKGLRNESTHDHIIDEYIIRKHVKMELALRDKVRDKGYSYIQHFVDFEQDLRVKALWVEIHSANKEPGMSRYRNAYGPPKMSEEQLVAAVTNGQRRKDMIEHPRHPPKRKIEWELGQAEQPETSMETVDDTPAPPPVPKKTYDGPTTTWGAPFGYKVENITLTRKPPPNLGHASTGQDQLAYIQYMLQAPLAPLLTPELVNATSRKLSDDTKKSEESLKQSIEKNGFKYAAGNGPERSRSTPNIKGEETSKSQLTPILTPHIVQASGHSRNDSRSSIASLKGLVDLKVNDSKDSKSKARDIVKELEAKAAKFAARGADSPQKHARTESRTSVHELIRELELKASRSRSSSQASVRSLRDLDGKVVNSHSRNGSRDVGIKVPKPGVGVENASYFGYNF